MSSDPGIKETALNFVVEIGVGALILVGVVLGAGYFEDRQWLRLISLAGATLGAVAVLSFVSIRRAGSGLSKRATVACVLATVLLLVIYVGSATLPSIAGR